MNQHQSQTESPKTYEPASIITKAPPLLWEYGSGPTATHVPVAESLDWSVIPAKLRRKNALRLPELTELQVVRHFKGLSQANFSIDRNMYPLGSCTMKYNPKPAEEVAAKPEFSLTHPYAPLAPGLRVLGELQDYLGELTGLPGVSLQPAAGAQGELAGVLIIRKAIELAGLEKVKTEIIIPDSAHGTNPATTAMAGFTPVTVKTSPQGTISLESIQQVVSEKTAGIMITNPNTLGLFEKDIRAIAKVIHDVGGYVYGDGANFNALAGVIKPGDYGIDIMHINVHKTFGTPHGGGGPGAGPVCVNQALADYLPGPIVKKDNNGRWVSFMPNHSIGRLRGAWGNFGILLRAYSYLIAHGPEGVRTNSIHAVLSANYLMNQLKDVFPAAYAGVCMHEYVAGNPYTSVGVHTQDIAKRLLDFGIHAPTVYFPLIVKEALMMEPTESESSEDLDRFIGIMKQIAREANETPDLLKQAPLGLPLKRVDEVLANRTLILKHTF